VGETWLHAAAFRYCGSIGPIEPANALTQALQDLGDVVVKASGLRGLFGVDGVLCNDIFFPVEVNPRYTASVEVLEYALGQPLLVSHCREFDAGATPLRVGRPAARSIVGKVILFARMALRFPADGPWRSTLRHPGSVEDLPDFADIPQAAQEIPKGRPILTFFARGSSVADCLDTLQRTAREVDRWLYRH